jgi:hypothetical protein
LQADTDSRSAAIPAAIAAREINVLAGFIARLLYLRRPPPPPREPPREPPYEALPRLEEPRLLDARAALAFDDPLYALLRPELPP